MKILFLNDFKTSTLQSDVLFHGLKSIFEEVVDYPKLNYMYGKFDVNNPFSLKTPQQIRNLFGIFGSDHTDRLNIVNKVKNNYFDYIFVADPKTVNPVLTEIIDFVPDNRLVWIDGSDSVFPEYYIAKGIYFKKEIEVGCIGTCSINLAIPKEKIKSDSGFLKNKFLADNKVLIEYESEKKFYSEIASSYFTDTNTNYKQEWDTMILYEAIANYSIPFYRNFTSMPSKMCNHLPKSLFEQVNAKIELEGFTWVYTNRDLYLDLQNKLRDYLIKNCTTQMLAKKIIDKLQSFQ